MTRSCVFSLAVTLQFLYIHFTTAIAAEIDLNCGKNATASLQCLGDIQHFSCSVNSVFLQWESSTFSSDIEFFNSPLGAVSLQELDNGFQASVTNKTAGSITSVLKFSSIQELHGTIVKCTNAYNGVHKTCTIAVKLSESPTLPMNLTSIQLTPETVQLFWTMEMQSTGAGESFGNVTYTVSIWTTPPETTNAENITLPTTITEVDIITWTTNATELVIQNINSSLEYHWFVEVENCMGSNRSLGNEAFQITSKVPDDVDQLTVCVYYSPVNNSYIAEIDWKPSFVNYQFQTPILYYKLYANRNGFKEEEWLVMEKKKVTVYSNSIYNFTLLAISDIGESINNPSVIYDTHRKLLVNMKVGDTFAVVNVSMTNMTSDGCTPNLMMYHVSFNYTKLINEEGGEEVADQRLFYYHSIADKEGKLILLKDLDEGSTYQYSIHVHGNEYMMMEPIQGGFITKKQNIEKLKVNISESYTIPSSNMSERYTMVPTISRNEINSFTFTTNQQGANSKSETRIITEVTCSKAPINKVGDERLYTTWPYLVMAILFATSVTLLLMICLMFLIMLKMRKNLRRIRTASSLNHYGNRPKARPGSIGGSGVVNRNFLLMTNNDAYATILSSPCSSPCEEYKDEFRKRYLT